jgi:aminoglycoside 3-N-acetyltransferase
MGPISRLSVDGSTVENRLVIAPHGFTSGMTLTAQLDHTGAPYVSISVGDGRWRSRVIVKQLLRAVLPESVVARVRAENARRRRAKQRPAYSFSRDEFRTVLTDALHLQTGDVVFVHSSVDRIGLQFPFFGILSLLREIVGDTGTILFPTYPRLAAHEALLSGEVFDVRISPSFTGILTEFARRQRGAIRSLNPTKSVVALGPLARELTCSHHETAYPYDAASPYYRLMSGGRSRVVGLGVSTDSMSFVHCVEDELKDGFPVRPYFPRLFEGRCVDYEGRSLVVPTYAHDPAKMQWRHISACLRAHVDRRVYEDLQIHGVPFFWAEPSALFEIMVSLARRGITAYDRRAYGD